jgi:teichuronic acid biosynthesis glycosyltransferase TuaG
MEAPQISIVIPTYNHAQFLRGALDSVLGQTFRCWEAIVVNNFSQDNTIDIIESYGDPRIRYVNFANHGVIAASRNYGIEQTDAPYVAFLDSDDTWYPQKLQKCMDRMRDGYDLVCHAEKWVRHGGWERDVFYGPQVRANYYNLLFEGNCISTSAVVVRRECVDRVGRFSEDPSFNTAEDYDLWLKLARDGARIGFLDDILGRYLLHDGNQSGAVLRNTDAVMAVVRRHLASLPRGGLRQALLTRRRLAIIMYGGARGFQDNGRYREATHYFIKALLHYPFVPRFYVALLLNTLHLKP